MPENNRYKVVRESVSGHCCFDFTIIDTTITENYKSICETFYQEQADAICDALNNADARNLCAPWLTLAHTLCTDMGIEQGHIETRIKQLRDKLLAGNQLCHWTPDEGDPNWFSSDCGMSFVFEEGGPVENSFKFCPKCGKALHEDPPVVICDECGDDPCTCGWCETCKSNHCTCDEQYQAMKDNEL